MAPALSDLDVRIGTGSDSAISNSCPQQGSRTSTIQSPKGPRSKGTKPSLWAYAYDRLRQENITLASKFEALLNVSTSSTEDKDDGNFCCKILNIQQQALEDIITAKDSQALSNTTSKIKRCFQRGIAVIVGARDFIGSAVSANPYAALAWSGVSLMLSVRHPFLLSYA